MPRARSRSRSRPKRYVPLKICKFCANKDWLIDYKDVNRLKGFIGEKGKIIPRRISGTCAMHQRELAVEIKKARNIAFLPFSV